RPAGRDDPVSHRATPPVHGCESLVDDGKALVDGLEALIDGVEALIDARKALAEESDELRILGRRHARSLPHPREAIKCINSWTIASSAELDLDPRAAPDSSGEARHELGDPHLQAVFRAHRGAL